MKKSNLYAILLVVLCLTLLLTGCDTLEKLKQINVPELPTITEAPEEMQQIEPENEQEEAVTEADEIHELDIKAVNNCVIVKINNVIEENSAYDAPEKTILTFSYDHPAVIIESNPKAAEKINNFLRKIEEEYYTGAAYNGVVGIGYNALLELAEENYYRYKTESAGTDISFISSRKVSVERIDDTLLSVIFRDYVYTGDGTGSFYDEAYNFDINSGELLTSEQLFKSFDSFSSFLNDYNIDLDGNSERTYFSFGKDKLSVIVNDKNGIEPSYTSIDYTDILKFINFDIFAPAAVGDVDFSIVDESFTGNEIDVIDKVIINNEADPIFLYIDGYSGNVKISSGYFSNGFYETQVNWYCSKVDDEIVQVCCNIPDGLPVLCVSYYDVNMKEIQLFFSKDENQGKPVLVPAESVISLG